MANATADEVTLKVDGMTCGHCASRVRKALAETPGVVDATVDLEAGQATVRVSGRLESAALVAAVEKAGYAAKAA